MESSPEYWLANQLVATAGKGAIATPTGWVDPVPLSATATTRAMPGIASSVAQLLVNAKRPVPKLGTLLFVVIALIVTALILVLAAADAVRGLLAWRRNAKRRKEEGGVDAGNASDSNINRKHQRHGAERHLLEEEDAPRLLGQLGWRPLYAFLVAASCVCQAALLIIYLQASRGAVARSTQVAADNAAFASALLPAFFLLLAAMPARSAASSAMRMGKGGNMGGVQHYLLLALVLLGPALAIGLLALGSTRYSHAALQLNDALRTLLDKPASCAGRLDASNQAPSGDNLSACSVYSLAFLLQNTASAAKTNTTLKAIAVLVLALLVVLVSHAALRALKVRQAALTDVHMQLEQARLENEDLGLGRSRGGSVDGRSLFSFSGKSVFSGASKKKDLAGGSVFRTGMSAEAERDYLRYLQGLGIHTLYASSSPSRGSSWSESSAASSIAAPTYRSHGSSSSASSASSSAGRSAASKKTKRKAPPSYRDLDLGVGLDVDIDSKGIDLDTSDAIGRALQRQYGSLDAGRTGTKPASKKGSREVLASSASAMTASKRGRTGVVGSAADEDEGEDEGGPRLPGYLNAPITKPEAAACASHSSDDDHEDGGNNNDGATALRRLPTFSAKSRSAGAGGDKRRTVRGRSDRDEMEPSRIVPGPGPGLVLPLSLPQPVHARSGRTRPRGARPFGASASTSSSYSSSSTGSYASSSPSTTDSRASSPSRSSSTSGSGSGSSWYRWAPSPSYRSHSPSRTTHLPQGQGPHPHPGGIALTLSAATASLSAALARTAPLRARARLNRLLGLVLLGAVLVLLLVGVACGMGLELGGGSASTGSGSGGGGGGGVATPVLALVLAVSGWVLSCAGHGVVLGLLILRGSGGVREVEMAWPSHGGGGAEGGLDVDLEAGVREK